MPLGLIELPWWGYVLVILGLTHVTIASVTIYLHRHQAHHSPDLDPVASHFFRAWLWLARFARSLKPTARQEVRQRQVAATLGLREERTLRAVQNGLQRGAENLPETERVILEQALAASPQLNTFYAMRQELVALWGRSSASREQLVKQLESWLRQAETSGVIALREFSRKLYGFG